MGEASPPGPQGPFLAAPVEEEEGSGSAAAAAGVVAGPDLVDVAMQQMERRVAALELGPYKLKVGVVCSLFPSCFLGFFSSG